MKRPAEPGPLGSLLHTYAPGHLFVCFLCHSEYVWVHVPHVLTTVSINDVGTIDRKGFIRVDGHKNDSCNPKRKQVE